MVHRAGVRNLAADALFRLQTKSADEIWLDCEVPVLALSGESVYTKASTVAEEVT